MFCRFMRKLCFWKKGGDKKFENLDDFLDYICSQRDPLKFLDEEYYPIFNK